MPVKPGGGAEIPGPPCPGKVSQPQLLRYVLSTGTKTPPTHFSAFLTLSGNSCSNFHNHLLPEMRTRIRDSAENSKIFMSSNLIFLDRRLLEPASFIENTSLRKKLKRRKVKCKPPKEQALDIQLQLSRNQQKPKH